MPTDISGEIQGKRATVDNPLAVALSDSDGNPIDSHLDADGGHHLGVTIMKD